MADKDYEYPYIEPTDYIDESLSNILARDDASKHSFRRVSTFPAVTTDDVGMKVYLIGRGNYQLVSADPEPQWKQLTDDKRIAAYTDWVIENYQPLSNLLTSFAKLSNEANSLPYFNGPDDVQATALTRFMMNLLAQTEASGAREALGLGTAATLDLPIDGSNIKGGSISVDKVSTSFIKSIGVSTGDVKLTYKTVADDGWVMANDGSIGSASSGATTRANSDTYNLFMLMWNIPACGVQTFSGASANKTTAIQDWSSNKRLILPKVLGRALACAGTGAGLSTHNLASYVGNETHTLTVAEIPSHNHNLYATPDKGDRSARTDTFMGSGAGNSKSARFWSDYYSLQNTAAVANTGGNQSHNNMQPTTFLNVMIKL